MSGIQLVTLILMPEMKTATIVVGALAVHPLGGLPTSALPKLTVSVAPAAVWTKADSVTEFDDFSYGSK